MRDPKIAEAAARAAEHFTGEPGGGHANSGKINIYTCEGKKRPAAGAAFKMVQSAPPCGNRMVTIDREPGVTPFITSCDRCGGEAVSALYRVPQSIEPTHEWYRPDSLDGLPRWSVEHVEKGGLLLRRIEKPARDGRANYGIMADDKVEMIEKAWAEIEPILERTYTFMLGCGGDATEVENDALAGLSQLAALTVARFVNQMAKVKGLPVSTVWRVGDADVQMRAVFLLQIAEEAARAERKN